jgi:predicted 2-oxoglutarate/Fe(II)-dependent dioxygenase YbiX
MITVKEKPEVVWDIPNKIFVRENVLDPELCVEIAEYGNNNVQLGVNKYSHAFQVKFDACLLPVDHIIHSKLENVWEDIINFLKFDIDFVEPYELKKYSKGNYFGKHIDNYYSITRNLDRKITMSVQLSNPSDYEGGEFIIAGNSFKLSIGSVLAFPSFFSHNVDLVKSGTRWSLIGWAWGPYWR